MKILITGALDISDKEIDKLIEIGYEVTYVKNELEKLDMRVDKFEAVICNGLFIHNDIDDFKELKFIQVTSAGLDRLPMNKVKNRGINVYNARGVYSIPMAEWVLLKLLEISKNTKHFIEAQKEKKWLKKRDIYELNMRTAIILGVGSVGSEIAKRLKAFNVTVIGVGRSESNSCSYIDEYYQISMIDKVLPKADILIISVPLTNETENMFDYRRLSIMQNESILVNVSRGNIVVEEDLVRLLENDKFLGCALDVFTEEPLPSSNKLWSFDRVYATPHNSFVSTENRERLIKIIEENLRYEIEYTNSITKE